MRMPNLRRRKRVARKSKKRKKRKKNRNKWTKSLMTATEWTTRNLKRLRTSSGLESTKPWVMALHWQTRWVVPFSLKSARAWHSSDWYLRQESVDIDDLSDGEMQKMDDALAAAFREFRKARPVRKNNSKLPKDVTALMHFRLRCLDLIEVLASTDKGIHINLAVPTLLPLLSLLEATVKEPLQKPLMDRTR